MITLTIEIADKFFLDISYSALTQLLIKHDWEIDKVFESVTFWVKDSFVARMPNKGYDEFGDNKIYAVRSVLQKIADNLNVSIPLLLVKESMLTSCQALGFDPIERTGRDGWNQEQKRDFGVEILTAIKAHIYDVSASDAKKHYVLDVVNLSGEWADIDITDPHQKKIIEHERNRLWSQVDFITDHILTLYPHIQLDSPNL